MAAWREVARRIAHEIKNPLTPIQLSAQRIRRRFHERFAAEPADARIFDECVDAITSQVETLKLLVDEFSSFARLPTANPRPGDLNQIIADAVTSYAGTDRVIFETDLDDDLPAVDLDREQIRRALTNLIDNAIAAVRRRDEREGNGSDGHVLLRSVHDAPPPPAVRAPRPGPPRCGWRHPAGPRAARHRAGRRGGARSSGRARATTGQS